MEEPIAVAGTVSDELLDPTIEYAVTRMVYPKIRRVR